MNQTFRDDKMEIKYIKEVLDEIRKIAKEQAEELSGLPEKIIIRTDEKYATKIELERLRSKINWYAWLTPIGTFIIGLLIAKLFIK